MMVKLVFKEKVLNVISVNTPQVGCEEGKRKSFGERCMR